MEIDGIENGSYFEHNIWNIKSMDFGNVAKLHYKLK